MNFRCGWRSTKRPWQTHDVNFSALPSTLFLLVVAVAALVPGCTALVILDDTAPLVCQADSDCAAGTVCDNANCIGFRTEVIPTSAVVVGAAGGTLTGPDGVMLEIPAGAVVDDQAFLIGRASSTLLFQNFEPRSRFYAISPFTEFELPARLVAPAALCGAVNSCEIFFQPQDSAETWVAFDFENAAITRTGVFAVGVGVEHSGDSTGEAP